MRIANGHNLRIAVQNAGRLTSRSLELLRGVGLEFEEHERRLFARCRNADVELLFIRDDDIPEYVQDGVADLGVVGRNVVIEQGSRVEELESLGFGFCTLALAVPREDTARTSRDLDGRRIATTHPAALRRYLDREGIDARVVEIRGAAEVAPALDVADAICDLVSTGTTLRINDLRRLGDVFERLRVRLRGLLVARHMKYVTLNAPRCALPRIQEILPGMKSPTVVPLAEEGMVALHAAVEEEVFWDVMERIKEAGGSEILVLPVEKVMR